MIKYIFMAFLMLLILAVCVVGPDRVGIAISGTDNPIISWNGSPAHFVYVALEDSVISTINDAGATLNGYHPKVWGYSCFDETGGQIDGIASPVRIGSLIGYARDISDSLYRQSALKPHTMYSIHIGFVDRYAAGVKKFYFRNAHKE